MQEPAAGGTASPEAFSPCSTGEQQPRAPEPPGVPWNLIPITGMVVTASSLGRFYVGPVLSHHCMVEPSLSGVAVRQLYVRPAENAMGLGLGSESVQQVQWIIMKC